MSTPKKHHYVPQTHIRRFYDQEKSVWFFEKQKLAKGVHRRRSESIFYKKHQNTVYYTDNSKDLRMENGLAVAEGALHDLTKYVEMELNQGQQPRLGPDHKKWFASYFVNQRTRVPEWECQIDSLSENPQMIKIVKEVYSRFENVTVSDEHAMLTIKEVIENKSQNASVFERFMPLPEQEESLKLQKLHFFRTPKIWSFVLGSNPIVDYHPAGEDHTNPLFGSLLPLTPNIVAVFGPQKDPCALITQQSVDAINLSIAKQSHSFCSNSMVLTQRFASMV